MSPEVLVMSQKAWQSLSAEDQKIFREAALRSSRFMREKWRDLEERRASRRRPRASRSSRISTASRSRRRWRGIYAKAQQRSGHRAADRTNSQGGVSWLGSAATGRIDAERPAGLAARGRFRIVQLLRAVPIRWRILSIAALNSAVVVVLAALIWNGAQVLGSAWEDVRQVRESDKILALLESETSRLQNLIHRYINQPSPELFAEILLLREAVLGTLTTRASTDPMLSGSVEQLEHVTDRFLNGFGELRAVQATIPRPTSSRCWARPRTWPGSIRSSRAPPGTATR